MKALDRIIGKYTGPERGPLIIAIGGMHGNELAGIRALDMLFHMLNVEPNHNPTFSYRGRLIGVRGNLPARRTLPGKGPESPIYPRQYRAHTFDPPC